MNLFWMKNSPESDSFLSPSGSILSLNSVFEFRNKNSPTYASACVFPIAEAIPASVLQTHRCGRGNPRDRKFRFREERSLWFLTQNSQIHFSGFASLRQKGPESSPPATVLGATKIDYPGSLNLPILGTAEHTPSSLQAGLE